MTAGRKPTPPGKRGNECRFGRPHRDGIENQTKSELLQLLNQRINSSFLSSLSAWCANGIGKKSASNGGDYIQLRPQAPNQGRV